MQPQGYGLRLRRVEVYSRFTLEVRNRVSILARSHFVVTVDKNINKSLYRHHVARFPLSLFLVAIFF